MTDGGLDGADDASAAVPATELLASEVTILRFLTQRDAAEEVGWTKKASMRGQDYLEEWSRLLGRTAELQATQRGSEYVSPRHVEIAAGQIFQRFENRLVWPDIVLSLSSLMIGCVGGFLTSFYFSPKEYQMDTPAWAVALAVGGLVLSAVALGSAVTMKMRP